LNPYQVLGLTENCAIEEVERAYKKLAFQYHPDRNIGDESASEKFREIQDAYDRIKKPEKYVNNNQGFNPFGMDFSNIFSFFTEDPNVSTTLEVNVKEIYYNQEKILSLSRKVTCTSCNGAKFSNVQVCKKCGGNRRIRQNNKMYLCSDCSGKGIIYDHECKSCNATGLIKTRSDISIKLPNGVKDGTVLRLNGAGNQFHNFIGDLLIKIKIVPYEKYYLVNDDLYVDLEVTFSKFVGGGEVEIKCLDDEVICVKILPKTPDNTKLRVKNKGFLNQDGKTRSDLVAKIFVQIPDITDVNVINQLANMGF